MLAAEVESPALRRSILDGHAKVQQASIADTAEHPLVNELCPALVFSLPTYQTVTPLEHKRCPAPANWREEATARGLAIFMRDGKSGAAWLETTPMRALAPGFVLPARSATKAGRNDPCPCGSGMKFKRCCGP